MKNIRTRFLLICLSWALQGCPYLTVLSLKNATDESLLVHGVHIAAGSEKDVGSVVKKDGSIFKSMEVEVEGKVCEYDLQSLNHISSDYYARDSRGVYYRTVIRDDMRLYIDHKIFAADDGNAAGDQPDGFPLSPIGC